MHAPAEGFHDGGGGHLRQCLCKHVERGAASHGQSPGAMPLGHASRTDGEVAGAPAACAVSRAGGVVRV